MAQSYFPYTSPEDAPFYQLNLFTSTASFKQQTFTLGSDDTTLHPHSFSPKHITKVDLSDFTI
tara:strand:+ start:474 stop:662 length:189 start_codon:yes stop_codon:yes gene_type:complete